MRVMDCVSRKVMPAESTEVFSIRLSSNTIDQRDEESQKPTIVGTKDRRWLWRIFLDIPLLALVTISILLFELAVFSTHKAGFYCNDPALSFKFQGDTVHMGVIVSTVLLGPPIVILLTELILSYKSSLNWTKFKLSAMLTSILTRDYLYGFFFNLITVELLKGLMGMPRPVFFDVCEPDTGKTCTGSQFVSDFTCTSTRFSLWNQNDSYHSFPSGHTSMSVYAGLFVAWYLQVRTFKWSNRTYFLVPFLQMGCIAYAIVCSITRITDHVHHWWDVLFGTIIGFATVYLAVVIISKNFVCLRRCSYENYTTHITVPFTTVPSTNGPSSESLLRPN